MIISHEEKTQMHKGESREEPNPGQAVEKPARYWSRNNESCPRKGRRPTALSTKFYVFRGSDRGPLLDLQFSFFYLILRPCHSKTC